MTKPPAHWTKTSSSTKSVTLKDIANVVGVSLNTVSKIMRGDDANYHADTIARVRAVARELGYDPALHHAARRLAMTRSPHALLNHAVGLFFPTDVLRDPYYVTLFLALLDHWGQIGYSVIATLYTTAQDRILPPLYERGDVDAAILIGHTDLQERVSEELRRLPNFGTRPLLSLIEPIQECSAVLVDDLAGGYLACDHLLAAGHRHLLCFADLASYPHQQRLAGCCQAYVDYGLDPKCFLHRTLWNPNDQAASVQAMRSALREHPGITALLAPSDASVLLITDVLRQLGRQVPRDISLVGYDDSAPLLDEAGDNMLTTIRVPLCTMAQHAVHLLHQYMTTAPTTQPEIVRLPVELIVRKSTAPLRS